MHVAAGGVGTLAVQLARHWGAGNVIGVASSAEKRQVATDLGAHSTVDAGAEDLKAALEQANGGTKVDIVLEMVGGETFDASLAALAHCFARPELLQPPMAELLSMVEAGTLKPVVGGSYPLSEAHRAHEDLRSRASQGKLLLDCHS